MCFLKGVLIIAALILTFLQKTTAACSDAELNTINDCYQKNIFDKYKLPASTSLYIAYCIGAAKDVKNIGPMCDSFKALQTCISDSTVKNCFNINDFSKVKFVALQENAIKMIANYLQIEYICGSANKLVLDKAQCALNIPKKCGTIAADYQNCGTADKYTKCAVDESKENCGAPASCFVQKFLSLQTCYYLQNCPICSNINYNNNPINSLCSDDSNYNAGNNNMAINLILILSIGVSSYLYFY